MNSLRKLNNERKNEKNIYLDEKQFLIFFDPLSYKKKIKKSKVVLFLISLSLNVILFLNPIIKQTTDINALKNTRIQ